MNESQNTQNNSTPSSSKPSASKKWLILGIVGLFVIGGGIFLFSKRNPTSTETAPTEESSSAPTGVGAASATGAGKTSGKRDPKGKSMSAPQVGMTAPSVPAAGAPSHGLATGTSTAMAPAAKAEQDECVTVTYKHKISASHPDEESCSHHKNQLKLTIPEGKKIADKSICVRVNGTPVHFLTVKGHGDRIIFGSVAGPKSKVTVRYCTGLAKGCAVEDCAVPKDEFMEAIGGSEGKGQNANLGRWDPTAPADKNIDVMAKLDGAIKHELETNDELNGRAPAGELYKDWIGEAQAQACGSAQAKN